MHVAILIVGYRNPQDIVTCLGALATSRHTDFEVFICENGGGDAVASLCAVIPARLPGGQPVAIHDAGGNLGFAGGVNQGFRHRPDADAWWVLNPDAQPEAGALTAMIARLQVGDCDAVGCILYRPDGAVQSYGGRYRAWLARAESIGNGARIDAPVDAAWVEGRQSYLNGASMLIGRPFLVAVGPMREDYFLYCEESEWCLRAARRGMRLGFASDARVLHAQGTTTGAHQALKQRPRLPVYLDSRNLMLLTRDLFPGWLPVAASAAVLQLALRYGRRGAWRQLGYGLAGWAAGLANRRGPPRP